MNLITKFISFFVPMTEGQFDRARLWQYPGRYLLTNGVCFAAFFIPFLLTTGWTHSITFAFSAVFTPMTTASFIAVVSTRFGHNPYSW